MARAQGEPSGQGPWGGHWTGPMARDHWTRDMGPGPMDRAHGGTNGQGPWGDHWTGPRARDHWTRAQGPGPMDQGPGPGTSGPGPGTRTQGPGPRAQPKLSVVPVVSRAGFEGILGHIHVTV